jgi:hypothetical protein
MSEERRFVPGVDVLPARAVRDVVRALREVKACFEEARERPDRLGRGTAISCAGLHPDFPDREEDGLSDCWAPFEGRITVGWE